MNRSFPIILIFVISACVTSYPKYISMLDQMDDFVWIGTIDDQKITLVIQNQDGHWFDGNLLLGNTDTLYLRGFEKGENHPTNYFYEPSDSIPAGSLFIWTKGLTSDTLDIINRVDSMSVLPKRLLLFKQELEKD